MNSGEVSSAGSPAPSPQHPLWRKALIVLAAFFVLSEIVYLVLGGIAKIDRGEGKVKIVPAYYDLDTGVVDFLHKA